MKATLGLLDSLPADRREAELDRLRQDEPELAAEVVSLLQPRTTPAGRDPEQTTPGGHEVVGPEKTHVQPEGNLDHVMARVSAAVSLGDPSADPDSVPPDVPGCQFDGGEENIRYGGMGVVYFGTERELRRPVAVKVLRRRLAADPVLVARFRDESLIAAQLQHPGIVPVYAIGRLADGRPYCTMKLVRGETFSDVLKRRPTPLTDLIPSLAIFRRVCEALGYAHGKRIIHRDLKPSNVMIGAHGEVLLVDWGLAKKLGDRHATEQTPEPRSRAVVVDTRTGGLETQSGLGSLPYLAPEQATGRMDEVDERSDVFGLGAILCVILTGQPPYIGPTEGAIERKTLRGDLEEAYDRLDGCGADPELRGLAKRCLAKDRSDRPADGSIVANLVATYVFGVEERLRQEELERKAAEVRVMEEQKRRLIERQKRKMTLILSIAMLLVLLGGVVSTTLALFRAWHQTTEAELAKADEQKQKEIAETKEREARASAEEERKAKEREKEQRDFADKQRKLAEKFALDADHARDTAQRQIVQLDLATGAGHTDRREYDRALHWLTKAWLDDLARIRLKSAQDLDPDTVSEHRMRVGSAIQKLPQLVGFCPHEGPVLDADSSPDGVLVATIVGIEKLQQVMPFAQKRESIVRVWDATKCELAYQPLRHEGPVTSVVFSEAGDHIATSSTDGAARLWDAKSGKLLYFYNHKCPISKVAFSPDGKTIASAAGDKVFRWSTTTGEAVGEPILVGASVLYVAYSPEGRKLVTGTAGESGTTQVWDSETGKPLSEPLPGPRIKPESILASRENSGVITYIEERRWPKFSSDGATLATADGRSVHLWTKDGVKKFELPDEKDIKQISTAFTPDGRYLCYTYRPDPSDGDRHPGNGVYLYDLKTGKTRRTHGASRWTNGLAVCPNRNVAAVPISVGNVEIFDLINLTNSRETLWHQNEVSQIQFTRNGRRLLVATVDGVVRVWGIPGPEGSQDEYNHDCGQAHQLRYRTRRLSPDGKWEASLEEDGWRIGKIGEKTYLIPNSQNAEVIFSPDGQHFVLRKFSPHEQLSSWRFGDAGVIALGSAKDPELIFGLAFSGNGRRLAASQQTVGFKADGLSNADILRVWDFPSLQKVFDPVDMQLLAGGVALNHDGSLLAAGRSGTTEIPCWDLRTGERLLGARPRPGNAHLITFSPLDDRLLVPMSYGSAQQWNPRTGTAIGGILSLTPESPVAYSPDQKRIACLISHTVSVAPVKYRAFIVVYSADTGELLASQPRYLNLDWTSPFRVKVWFSKNGDRVIVHMPGTTYTEVWRLPEFPGPVDQLPALVRLLTGQSERPPQIGLVPLDAGELSRNSKDYRRAFRAWKGLHE